MVTALQGSEKRHRVGASASRCLSTDVNISIHLLNSVQAPIARTVLACQVGWVRGWMTTWLVWVAGVILVKHPLALLDKR